MFFILLEVSPHVNGFLQIFDGGVFFFFWGGGIVVPAVAVRPTDVRGHLSVSFCMVVIFCVSVVWAATFRIAGDFLACLNFKLRHKKNKNF